MTEFNEMGKMENDYSLIYYDIDDFKSMNDNHGYLKGDTSKIFSSQFVDIDVSDEKCI